MPYNFSIRCTMVGGSRSNLALVEVDNVVQNDWLKERGRLGRRPAGIERRFNAWHHVRRGQHHVEHVQEDHLSQCPTLFTPKRDPSNLVSFVHAERLSLLVLYGVGERSGMKDKTSLGYCCKMDCTSCSPVIKTTATLSCNFIARESRKCDRACCATF